MEKNEIKFSDAVFLLTHFKMVIKNNDLTEAFLKNTLPTASRPTGGLDRLKMHTPLDDQNYWHYYGKFHQCAWFKRRELDYQEVLEKPFYKRPRALGNLAAENLQGELKALWDTTFKVYQSKKENMTPKKKNASANLWFEFQESMENVQVKPPSVSNTLKSFAALNIKPYFASSAYLHSFKKNEDRSTYLLNLALK